MPLFSHGVLLWFAWTGSLGYLGMILIYAAELLLIDVTSIPLYLSRGVSVHLFDALKMSFALFLFLAFNIFGYDISMAPSNNNAPLMGFGDLVNLDVRSLLIAIGYMVLRTLMIFTTAATSKKPRLSWARSTLVGGGVTMVTLFFMAFLSFAGGVIVPVVHWVYAGATVSAVLSTLFVAVHFGASLIVAKMPQKELAEIAEHPYVQQ